MRAGGSLLGKDPPDALVAIRQSRRNPRRWHCPESRPGPG